MNRSVVTLPYRFSVSQRCIIDRNVASPRMSWMDSIVVAPRLYIALKSKICVAVGLAGGTFQ